MTNTKESHNFGAGLEAGKKVMSLTEGFCHEAAIELDGRVEKLSNGDYSISTTLGNYMKFYLSRDSMNLNKMYAVIAVSYPMQFNQAEVYIDFAPKEIAWARAERLKEEVALNLLDDMNTDVETRIVPIERLLTNPTKVWFDVEKNDEGIDLGGWFHIGDSGHHFGKINLSCWDSELH